MTATLKSFNYFSYIINSRLQNSTILSYRRRRRLPRSQPPTSCLNPGFRFFQSNHLFCTQSGSLMEVFKAVCSEGSNSCDRLAIKADEKSYSYGQLTSSALTISKLFCREDTTTGGETKKYEGFGSLKGARVGIVAKPSAEFVAGVLGTWFSGGVAVPLALSYPEAELLYVMSNSDISVLLSTEDHSETMKTIAAKSDARFLLIPPLLNSTSETVTNNQFQDDSFGEDGKLLDDPALIVYTSGTTGKPKGVVHTHKSINSQVRMLTEAWEYTSADHFLHCLPLHHVHGLFNALFAPLYARSSVEFLPKFSVSGIWRRWRESYPVNDDKTDNPITVFTGVPTMYTRLIQGYEAMDQETKESSAFAAQKLRLMMSGSSALPRPVMHQWESITGHRLLERYGMTEFVMAISNPLRGARKAGTVGEPLPGVEAKIVQDVNDADGVGEICVKSPSLFKEYWNLPEVTKESFTEDGYFKTGDAGRVDEDGYYVILGRTSADIMKVGGYKLSALEIESTLLEHPTVAECCVLGLPDKDYGEAVTAIIVAEAGAKRKRDDESKPVMTLEELCGWAKDKLAPYKLPTRLLIWESLPRNAMGKVNKKELKKSLDHQE
ncbi:PREDICTED: malonate--CoA ligase [Brassica oleracea var. oleracea]|uniref:malonate--CoA ligase n=1 Tax=Brassica oleracea var. oleracea TaxID=109376 RepID=A0A0D3CJP6_BRAOL|nr:PREDICTED: malonate--CoA ligase [Brassica oleracea var. oleracea]